MRDITAITILVLLAAWSAHSQKTPEKPMFSPLTYDKQAVYEIACEGPEIWCWVDPSTGKLHINYVAQPAKGENK